MSMIPNLKKIDAGRQETEIKDPKADLKKVCDGIHAMSEDMATSDIISADLLEKLNKGEALDMDDMKVLAGQLGEIYEIVNELLDIVEEYVPPEDDEDWIY